MYFANGERVKVGSPILSDDGFKDAEHVKVYNSTADEPTKAVDEKVEVKPVHPVSLVKLGIGYGSIGAFFVVFPFLVFGLRKVVEIVREWRKPRFY